MASKMGDPQASGSALRLGAVYRWYVLVLVAVVYAIHAMDRNIINVLQEPIKREFHLSDSALGTLTGLGYALPFALAGLPLGALADRSSRKRLLAALVAAWSVFTALGGLAGGFASLLATRMAVGTAESGSPPTALALISDYFAPRLRATAVGVFYVGAPVGSMVGSYFGGAIAASHGWRAALFVAAIPGLLAAAAIALTVREPVRGGLDPEKTSGSVPIAAVFALIARTPGLAVILAALVLASMSAVGVSAWTAPVVMRAYKLPVAQAGSFMALLGFAGIGGALTGSLLSDRFAKGRTERLILIAGLPQLAAVGPLLVAMSSHTLAAFTLPYVLWTFILPIYYGAGFSLALGLAPAQMRGRLMAVTFVLCNILGAGLGPQIIGLLSDAFSKAGDPRALPHAVAALSVAVLAAGAFFLSALWFVPRGVAGAAAAQEA